MNAKSIYYHLNKISSEMNDRLPIEVEIRNGVGYVWNFKDVLRKQIGRKNRTNEQQTMKCIFIVI